MTLRNLCTGLRNLGGRSRFCALLAWRLASVCCACATVLEGFMITFAELIEAVDAPQIQALDTAAFTPADIVNIILQRSEVIRDQHRPGKIVNAWT